ncbi:Thiol-disulfide isomerase or thioredoxin [bacterium A37T11]|nr:Thiol-disulfide isomerase or thioredoxin [bacterium A37T11]
MKQILRSGESYALSPTKRTLLYISVYIGILLLPVVAPAQSKTRTVTGTVVSAPGGKPIAGARIRLGTNPDTTRMAPAVRTDKQGTFTTQLTTDLGIPEGGLKIGDTIPEALWHLPQRVVNTSSGKDTITLNDIRNRKLIILDFWSTWCSPCIASIDKIHKLMGKYDQTEVAFLPVMLGKSEEADKFIKKRGWILPSLINESPSDKAYIPKKNIISAFKRYIQGFGTIWIYQNRLLAIPFSNNYINDSILNMVLAEKKVNFINLRRQQEIDPNRPLFTKGNAEAHIMYRNKKSASIARYSQDVYHEGSHAKLFIKGDSSILYATNLALEFLYFEAFNQEIFPAFNSWESGIIWEIGDSLRHRIFSEYRYVRAKATLQHQIQSRKWLENNLYGYQLRFPERLRESEARYFMQQDLNKFFSLYLGIRANIEYRNKQKYAVLRLRGTMEETEKLLTQEPAGLKDTLRKNLEYRRLVNYDQHFKGDLSRLIQQTASELQLAPLIDSTGIQLPGYAVNSLLPKGMVVDLPSIQSCLAKYKLYVTLEDKAVPLLVVREIRNQQQLSGKP